MAIVTVGWLPSMRQITSDVVTWRHVTVTSSIFFLWKTLTLNLDKYAKCSRMGPFLAANTVEISRGMDLTEGWRVGIWVSAQIVRSSHAARHCFTLDWRNIVEVGGRGRCHTLWLVLVRRAEAAHCRSSCYRKSPHSSDSGAVQRGRKRELQPHYVNIVLSGLLVHISGCTLLNCHHSRTDLSSWDGELLFTQLAVAGVLVLQPNLTPLKHS